MLKKFLIPLFVAMSFPSVIFSQKQPAIKNVQHETERPKLVVGLVLDQFRWDYLVRYNDRFSNRGFKRLMAEGFNYHNTFIPYAPAVTAAGHASLYTGSVPALTGIVGNDWIEQSSGYKMYCTRDTTVRPVGGNSKSGEMSPKNLLTTTIGDQLRIATNFASRVYGVALKDRGGIIPAGQSANAAYWLDDKTGNWISSTWYMNNLPQWVNDFNSQRKADSLLSSNWNLLHPPLTYKQSTADDNAYEKPLKFEQKPVFPHVYKSQIGVDYLALRESPYGNTLTLDFANQLIRNEKLGTSGQTDMICISLSSTDYVGHKFGTHSMEVEDMYIRLDAEIADFIDGLNKQFGKNGYLLFLSADHGVSNTPAFLKDHNISAGHLTSSVFAKEINAHCEKVFGIPKAIRGIIEFQVYLDHKLIDSLQDDKQAIKKEITKFILSKDEVVYAWDYELFDKVILPAYVKEMFANGYHYKRTGDIQFILKPHFSDVQSTGAEHGTWYNYDTHIPLIWYGWNVKPGNAYRKVYMTDVAPTIAALLKIQMPASSIGKVLEEVCR